MLAPTYGVKYGCTTGFDVDNLPLPVNVSDVLSDTMWGFFAMVEINPDYVPVKKAYILNKDTVNTYGGGAKG